MSVCTYDVHQFNANVGFVLFCPFGFKTILFSVRWGWCMMLSVKKVFGINQSTYICSCLRWPAKWKAIHFCPTVSSVHNSFISPQNYCSLLQTKIKAMSRTKNEIVSKEKKSCLVIAEVLGDNLSLWQFFECFISFHWRIDRGSSFFPSNYLSRPHEQAILFWKKYIFLLFHWSLQSLPTPRSLIAHCERNYSKYSRSFNNFLI